MRTASVHAGIRTPPPGCGPRDPPQPDPSTSPLGVGLEELPPRLTETCKACWDTTPTPTLWTESQTHVKT